MRYYGITFPLLEYQSPKLKSVQMTAFVDRKYSKWTKEALKDTQQKVFWTDTDDSPKTCPSLKENSTTDLVIIGGGYTGLWAALQAKEDQPNRNVVVLEAKTVGFGASSRNGGFCEPSLTHGIFNGLERWKDEMETILRCEKENFEGFITSLKKYNINADIEHTGVIDLATAPWQIEDLKEKATIYKHYGEKVRFLNTEEIQNEIHSPTNLAGLKSYDETHILNPAKLVWGLKEACISIGVIFYENTKVLEVKDQKDGLLVKTPKGTVSCKKVISATNAWATPLKEIRKHIITIYDHILMTEPLTVEQLHSIGWKNREGLSDASNQFHYYRLTKDNRILWGGWDANYYKNSGMGEAFENREPSFQLLSDHFFEAFPQLENQIRFTHRWAGPIGTTSQFTSTYGKKFKGKLVWVGGYTGLGVGASRFGARVALDLSENVINYRTQLKMVQKKPLPFPPEPFRHFFIQYTKRKIAACDANNGEKGAWLKLLDQLGLGFDS